MSKIISITSAKITRSPEAPLHERLCDVLSKIMLNLACLGGICMLPAPLTKRFAMFFIGCGMACELAGATLGLIGALIFLGSLFFEE